MDGWTNLTISYFSFSLSPELDKEEGKKDKNMKHVPAYRGKQIIITIIIETSTSYSSSNKRTNKT
jgi:hypothetical protein